MRTSWCIALLLPVACMGRIGDPVAPEDAPGTPRADDPKAPPGTPVVSACDAESSPASPATTRALTPTQYENAVRDLLQDPGFTPTFDDAAPVLTERGVRQLRNDAEAAVERRGLWGAGVIPCDATGPVDDACASEVIARLGRLAYRRSLTSEEAAWLDGVYRSARDELGFEDAVDVVVQVLLQSPGFLYVNEATGAPGVRALDDHELATRLAMFLWNSIPDEALLVAAESGELTSGGLRDQAKRLLESPRAEPTIQRFFAEWLALNGTPLHDSLEAAMKDAERFPEYDAALVRSMRAEVEHLVRDVVSDGGSLSDLLTTRRAHVDAALADLYGLEGEGDVELPEGERAGLLTRAAFLAVYASPDVQSPIRRGVFVIEEVLCRPLGEPPPNANDVPVTGGTVYDEMGGEVVRSVRQDVEARTGGGGTCVACHSVINPAGFPFEHYDAIGRFRERELGTDLPIDTAGQLTYSDVNGPIADAVELSATLAGSKQVRDCFTKRWLSTATATPIEHLDRCAVERLTARIDANTSVTDLILDVIESEAFSHVVQQEAP